MFVYSILFFLDNPQNRGSRLKVKVMTSGIRGMWFGPRYKHVVRMDPASYRPVVWVTVLDEEHFFLNKWEFMNVKMLVLKREKSAAVPFNYYRCVLPPEQKSHLILLGYLLLNSFQRSFVLEIAFIRYRAIVCVSAGLCVCVCVMAVYE